MPPTGHIEAGEIEMDEDGRFELVPSSAPQEKNLLPMAPDTGTLIVRQTFLDRKTEVPADLHIERINCLEDERHPSSLTPGALDEGLKSASTLFAGASLLLAKWAGDFQRHGNRLPMFDPDVSNAADGDPSISYYHSHWSLAADEALVTQYEKPYRPLAVWILNAAARLCGLPGRLDVAELVARAGRRTGPRDFGDEWFLEHAVQLREACVWP